ncbi:adenine phosphoribosyltransferase [Mesonia sp. HuA40]|uniref:adenine phosphoribosyltransferase n=1 Tax=Mesonia sp. HuA40 TaxID=2602761 RepID=UPI0011C7FA3C|nr:adenine phosphoribosyltransferase [Mesonia sp. HuA40]TXK73607.1 adenine phosphoribosyltransferase [Mesonia sp. HuA40]
MDLKTYIRDVVDFPKPGIIYKDITPLLQHPEALRKALADLKASIGGLQIDKVVGVESRGFIFASMLAVELQAGFVMIRKANKLPFKTLAETYSLEYGQDQVEIHQDYIKRGDRVLLHDDVLASGGTAYAAVRLIEKLGGEVVQCNFLLELVNLKGRKRLGEKEVFSLLSF